MTVFWSDLALESIAVLVEYLERFSGRAAQRVVLGIANRIDLAEESPLQGRMVPEFDNRTVREVFVEGYRIWYRVMGSDVEVIAIFHGARDTRR